ncbi:UNVERIFIED_CONTAM: hypothetical protein Scaly_0595200 [Sesamum calycinum]|uniref:Retrotransposon Copia-like N-terminal domain-containing protein n=1 Tax=Sesamum calycinum TaxID=2727403 RepID=A0AAW2RSM4_9LAMI
MATTEDESRGNVGAANSVDVGSGTSRISATPWRRSSRMVLVSAPFDGTDFLAWQVMNSLRAKMKLGFIDGHYPMPDKTCDTYETWIRWIRWQLWLDLEERYGENNGPLVYQLQRAIASITQGSHTVVEYFNNLTTLWDELECLKPPKTCTCGLCTCGFTRITAEEENLTKLVQFLMGLDDSYDNIRNQILVMDPFPSVNKAYSMVLRVERQRMVHTQTEIVLKMWLYRLNGLITEETMVLEMVHRI